jgi:hypothetical protein
MFGAKETPSLGVKSNVRERDPFPPVGQALSRAASSRSVADALKPLPVRELGPVRRARR